MSDNQIDLIHKNIQFIISHFRDQEFKFPRTIITYKTNGQQIPVQTEDEMINYMVESDFRDCMVNGYPLIQQNNKNKKLYPSFIFIELNMSLCNTCRYPIRKLDYILNNTLKNIKEEINGYPTVLWTGNAYHIYQPIRMSSVEKVPLELITEFKELPITNVKDLTTEFIRFANDHLTKGKNGPQTNLSTESCFIRIPGTVDSKTDEKVKKIQRWNGNNADVKVILPYFLKYLNQIKLN